MKTDTLRKKYLDFFSRKGHRIVPSSSLVPIDDPTLLFTSAGMNQFKKEFLGHDCGYKRAASSQRCLRTDDLDKVGLTSGHHTFFEMLGNFSFGDYFKEEAISFAWEFLINEIKLDHKNLWVSVYIDDKDAYGIWKEIIKFPQEKIVKLGAKDNFWPANAIIDGPNGPCGECSEIFFDYGKDTGCKGEKCLPGCSCGRFVEIWNLVFTQYSRKDAGILEPLPAKNIDTGMGLERMMSVLESIRTNSLKTNFQTDIFLPLTEAILNLNINARDDKLINAIADHIRAASFAIFDGVLPSNEQRGYVVRKLIRKAGFHGYMLGIKKPFLHELVPIVAKEYIEPYPDLNKRKEEISHAVLKEEEAFSSTLDKAPQILKNTFNEKKGQDSGLLAFMLHDTYGIPLEITKSWAKGKGIEINEPSFYKELDLQRERSKKSTKISSSVFAQSNVIKGIKSTNFIGYEKISSASKILQIINGGKNVKSAKTGEGVEIILDKTPFYAESGGQAGDKGVISKNKKAVFNVENTIKQDKIIIHSGKVIKGVFKIQDKTTAIIDNDFRKAVARAHTACHMLQSALREVLGKHVRQAGSFVETDRLRFDFTHPKHLAPEEIKKVEAIIQEKIIDAIEVKTSRQSYKKAKKSGALAFFGEKYEDLVRVVDIGGYSTELCGGTHLKSTAQIGMFKIISESSIAKGLRRIEAVVGRKAIEITKQDELIINSLLELLKTPKDKLTCLIRAKIDSLGTLEKQISEIRLNLLRKECLGLIKDAQDIRGIKVITYVFNDAGINSLRQMADFLKANITGPFAIALSSIENNKAWIIVCLWEGLKEEGILANDIIKEIAPIIDGNGGGSPQLAQAGGTNYAAIDKALIRFKEILQSRLNS